MLKAVIFDFDGVVADSEQLHFEAFNKVLEENFNIEISKKEYWNTYLGYCDRECFETFLSDKKIYYSPETILKLVNDKLPVFEDIAKNKSSIIDGVIDFLKLIKRKTLITGICSGATTSDIKTMLEAGSKLNNIDLSQYFDFIVSADDVVKSKPDPESFILALKEVNKIKNEVRANECLVIEDSHWGLEAAKAANMKTVAVTNTYSKEELDGYCDIIVDSLLELNNEMLELICT